MCNSRLCLSDKKQREGTTIVEVLVALSLLALFIAGACLVVMANKQLTDKSRAHYIGTYIAKNQIEQIRNTTEQMGFDQIQYQSETDVQINNQGDRSNTGKFLRTTTITYHSSHLAEIEVSVQILDREKLEFGDEKTVISSFISKRNGAN